MDDAKVLKGIEELMFVKTKAHLSLWAEKHLVDAYSPSSVLIALQNPGTEFLLTPYFSTTSFPSLLLKAFNNEDPCYSVPLLQEWRDTGYPVISPVLQDEKQQDVLWRAVFRQKGFAVAAVAASINAEEKYMGYLCMTDPKIGDDQIQKNSFSRYLAIITPILANMLFQLQREWVHTEQHNSINKLTRREREILDWIRKGKTNYEISRILGVAFPTVKNHVQRILIKLQVSNRTQAISKISSHDIQL